MQAARQMTIMQVENVCFPLIYEIRLTSRLANCAIKSCAAILIAGPLAADDLWTSR